MSTNVPPTTPGPQSRHAVPTSVDTAALPDDPAVLKQMIAELLRALRASRRDQEALQQRLDALLRRLYGPRPGPVDPQQPLLFAPLEEEVPVPPPAPASDDKPSRRGKTNKPHGRRPPSRALRHEQRRYQLTASEQLCPACGGQRQEISVESTCQYDYQPAEVFVL